MSEKHIDEIIYRTNLDYQRDFLPETKQCLCTFFNKKCTCDNTLTKEECKILLINKILYWRKNGCLISDGVFEPFKPDNGGISDQHLSCFIADSFHPEWTDEEYLELVKKIQGDFTMPKKPIITSFIGYFENDECLCCGEQQSDSNCFVGLMWKGREQRKKGYVCLDCFDRLQTTLENHYSRNHIKSECMHCNESKPEKNIIKNNKRRPLPKGIRHEVLKRDNFHCSECGKSKDDEPLEIDHIIPVSKGGTDELGNLRTLCRTCNREKSDLSHGGNGLE